MNNGIAATFASPATRLSTRHAPPRNQWQLEQGGVHPLLARLYAARGITSRDELDYGLAALLPPDRLKNAAQAAGLLADAIESQAKILIVADYDCDGATACAVGIRALRALAGAEGVDVDYLVPSRFTDGYGLTPPLADLAAARGCELLVTVDNGIASLEGIARARALGMTTLITDHHLPGATLPEADCIVNPNQPDCTFPSKHLAGVGVMFYVMLALRAELRARGRFATTGEPNLAALLDLVALGTVADVVRLDHNNRVLVHQGLKRIRAGKLTPGLRALFRAAGREMARATAFDLGFVAGPRLNAAGRLADMSLGIEALLADDEARALNLAQQLDVYNRERKTIEAGMQEQAISALAELACANDMNEAAIALFDPNWHQGVIGILAARIKEQYHRPVFAFARSETPQLDQNEDPGSAPHGKNPLPATSNIEAARDELKGSGRSIPGLHLRDALDLIDKRAPGLLKRFGGHAMAAGTTILAMDFPRFRECFTDIARELLDPAALTRVLETDGALEVGYLSLDTAKMLEEEVWGQGFPPPLFADEFIIEHQRLLKDKHLKLRLRKGTASFDAICFNFSDAVSGTVRAAYRLSINEFNGVQSLQFVIEHLESAKIDRACCIRRDQQSESSDRKRD